ncbi:MAG: hypothetical protein EOO42_07620 [Flavobacteriales bacterium]|nr:MAG: hypothetical protein EOO42_07620 [Flavobacteriales bacterium]
MKCFFALLFLVMLGYFAKAQNGVYEIKVVSKQYATVRGFLKKVSPEGIGVEDYKGKYVIFRPAEIERLKIRKRGLTIGEGTLKGGGAGLLIGAAIWSLDENGSAFEEMAVITGSLGASGAVIGTVAGVVADIRNTKMVLKIESDQEKFKNAYKKLEPYVNTSYVEHVN